MGAVMEFELNGHTYRAGKLNARDQFHIVRRLAPVLGNAAGSSGMDALPPIADAIASLSDEQADYVLFGLLRCVQRKQPQGLGWAAVSTEHSLMYDDITMPVMMQLAWKALQHNMADFLHALPSASSEATQRASGQSAG